MTDMSTLMKAQRNGGTWVIISSLDEAQAHGAECRRKRRPRDWNILVTHKDALSKQLTFVRMTAIMRD